MLRMVPLPACGEDWRAPSPAGERGVTPCTRTGGAGACPGRYRIALRAILSERLEGRRSTSGSALRCEAVGGQGSQVAALPVRHLALRSAVPVLASWEAPIGAPMRAGLVAG